MSTDISQLRKDIAIELGWKRVTIHPSGLVTGVEPGFKFPCPVVPVHEDTDVALRHLPLEKGDLWRFAQTDWGWKVFIQKDGRLAWLTEADAYNNGGDTLAVAICKAWLYYREHSVNKSKAQHDQE